MQRCDSTCTSTTLNCCFAGERRWVVTDIVGAEDGLGVECLSGSGAIASVYARAFREGFTITLVSGRTVGIGAYLARLGRRCIQRADQPIILTGFSALNKLLGREVYTSQLQLGGPKVCCKLSAGVLMQEGGADACLVAETPIHALNPAHLVPRLNSC